MVLDSDPRSDAPATGRPRDELREQAILDSAIVLLTEVGYDRLSIDMLATRARASKATIYRRWSGKAEVVTEAVRRRKCPDLSSIPDSGSFREDLCEFFLGSVSSAVADAALLAGLVRAMRDDPELNDLMRTQVIEPKHAVVVEMIARAAARGELPPDADATPAIEAIEALVFSRFMLDGRPLDEEFVTHLIDDVALPLLRR